jgi:hypothetical protein
MRFVVVGLLAGALVACGGGGGGGGGASTPATHVVTATAQTGGTVSPTSATVSAGATASFTVTAVSGYVIGAVTGCGGALSGGSYTTGSVSAACTVTATFTPLDFHVDVTGNSLGGLAIENNGGDRIDALNDGRYKFSTGINVGASYSVRVAQQPVAQVCRVTNGDGVISTTSPAVNVQCVNRIVSTSLLTLRTALDGAGQFEQFLYFSPVTNDLHQFRIRAADGGLDEVAPAWGVGPLPSTFTFSADGTRVFADDVHGTVSAAAVRGSDGAVVPLWTAPFGNYIPTLPLGVPPARPSHDGRMLYRNVTQVVSGWWYRDLWVGTVSDTGVTLLGGLPFALASDGGAPNFDPSGRYWVRLSRSTRSIDVYGAFASTTQQPELHHEGTQTLQGIPNVTLFAEGAPGKYLYESSFASESGATQTEPPQMAIHEWQPNGSLAALGGALVGGALTGEIAAEVCLGAFPTTSRRSFFGPLPPATARSSRYLLQRQDTTCTGGPSIMNPWDTRVLGVYLMTVANGQAVRTKLPLDTRPEWPDLGGSGWVHPSRPWLYLGSKHSQRVYAYVVDETAGTVQPIAGSPFDAAPLPSSSSVSVPVMIMDPTERFLYLTRNSIVPAPSEYLAAFAVDATTGALTPTATYTP